MVDILIMSDSHGLKGEIEMIKERHQLTHMIHCGDSELSADDPVLSGMVNVKGNCDSGPGYVNTRQIEINGVLLFVTHGHMYNVKDSLLALSYQAQEKDVDIVCFGHSHIAGAEQIGKQLFINPGSIRIPRQHPEKTYAILTINQKEFKVKFYTVSGNRVKDLDYQVYRD